MDTNAENGTQQNGTQQPVNTIIQSLPPVPNSTGVLVLGILSIVFCWCYGIPGIAMGIIALVMASKGLKAYQENPQGYSTGSYNNIKAGKICALIGTILSGLYILFIIIYFLIIGAALSTAFSTMPWDNF